MSRDGGGDDLNSHVIFTADDDATYYVSASAYGSREGAYRLSVKQVTDDYSATKQTTGAVAVGGSVTGEIDYGGDRDWFAVTLDAGQTYRFDLEGARTRDGTLYNPYLRGIYDANGHLIAGTTDNNGGVGLNSQVDFTPTANATYYVAVGAAGTGEGTYTLSVRNFHPDDFGQTPGTSGAVEVDGSVTGEIDYRGDRDWFAVEFEAGKTYQIQLEGSSTGAGTLDDPSLRGVIRPDGLLSHNTTNDDSGVGLNSLYLYTARSTGTYHVAASASGHRRGTYALSVTEVTTDDYVEEPWTSGAVEVGGSVTGEIEIGATVTRSR